MYLLTIIIFVMQANKDKGITWNAETLNEYLKKPRKFIPLDGKIACSPDFVDLRQEPCNKPS